MGALTKPLTRQNNNTQITTNQQTNKPNQNNSTAKINENFIKKTKKRTERDEETKTNTISTKQHPYK